MIGNGGFVWGEKKKVWPFLIQFVTVAFVPAVVFCSLTPANVLNSDRLWRAVEFLGISGLLILLFFSLPIGITGMIFSRKKKNDMKDFRIAARVLALINIAIGCTGICVAVLIMTAAFGGYI